MTKRKTTAFSGAWMDGRVPVAMLRAQMENEGAAIESESIESEAIIEALSRQHELWKFNTHRIVNDPEPAQWASLLQGIKVPALPSPFDVERLRHRIRTTLPARVRGVLNTELFTRADISERELFEHMAAGDVAAADLLRIIVTDMIEGARYIKGKRGPKLNVGPPFRAVLAVVIANSTMRETDARVLAADLLRMCGIPAPESRGRLAELAAPPRSD